MPVAVHKRTCLVIALVSTIILVYFAAAYIDSQQQLAAEKKEHELIAVAVVLEHKLSPVLERLAGPGMMPAGLAEWEKRDRIHSALQPVLEEVSAKHPSYSLGVYLNELKVVAVVPFNSSRLGQGMAVEQAQSFNTQSLSTPYLENDFTRNGKPCSMLMYPVYVGTFAGYIWVGSRARDWETEMVQSMAGQIAVFFVCWLLFMILLWRLFNRLDRSLHQLALDLVRPDMPWSRLREYPVLAPVFAQMAELREMVRTEQENKEKMRREISRLDRLQLVSQMAAGVAHEIRNPMTVVMGFVQMMAQKAEERAKSKFALIMDELKRVNDIISDFLSLARDKELERGRHSLNDIIQGLYPLIYADTVKQGIDLLLELEEPLPTACLDSKETKQLILNLTRNAIEAMGERGRLTIRTSRFNDKVRLCIADTGCGIPQDILDKVFDPFFTTKAEGTGLGLAVCKSIVDRHEGSIEVQSQPGQGTTFTIYFQVAGDC